MVSVAQLVEHLIVVQDVASSSLVTHPPLFEKIVSFPAISLLQMIIAVIFKIWHNTVLLFAGNYLKRLLQTTLQKKYHYEKFEATKTKLPSNC